MLNLVRWFLKRLSILIFRGTSLQLRDSATLLEEKKSFNPHFQRHFTATFDLEVLRSILPDFQSSFSEAFHCNIHPSLRNGA